MKFSFWYPYNFVGIQVICQYNFTNLFMCHLWLPYDSVAKLKSGDRDHVVYTPKYLLSVFLNRNICLAPGLNNQNLA